MPVGRLRARLQNQRDNARGPNQNKCGTKIVVTNEVSNAGKYYGAETKRQTPECEPIDRGNRIALGRAYGLGTSAFGRSCMGMARPPLLLRSFFAISVPALM